MNVILIVDDEFDTRRALELLLQIEGFTVMSAPDGEVALEKLTERRPDLIVTDWMMPRMDGREFCKRVRGNPETKDIPIIMVTAAAAEIDTQVAPWNVLLSKPLYFDRLMAQINKIFEGQRP